MTTLLRALARGAIPSAFLVLALIIIAGCASDDGPRPRTGKDSPGKAPLPTLAGKESFFDGQILAEMKVGAMTGFKSESEIKGEDGEGKRHGHGGGGGGGGRRRPGGDEPAPAVNPDNADRQRQMAARRADRTNTPPVIIHLRFTNKGDVPIELVIADFLSPLGNFVVTPGKLSIQPGQAVEVDPMASRLAGEITGGEISLNLRLGSRQETKIIVLNPEPVPAAPAATPQP